GVFFPKKKCVGGGENFFAPPGGFFFSPLSKRDFLGGGPFWAWEGGVFTPSFLGLKFFPKRKILEKIVPSHPGQRKTGKKIPGPIQNPRGGPMVHRAFYDRKV
ncbi:hypothetical protein EBI_26846, partial [Enterocytozoon bieneusi H348]